MTRPRREPHHTTPQSAAQCRVKASAVDAPTKGVPRMTTRCERCGKTSHSTWRRAIRAALHDSQTFGAAFRAYRCPRGNGWHLTTMRKAA